MIPNIQDPQAVDAQTVCPGYKCDNLQYSDTGLTAELTLAGPACNIYGTDIEHLSLKVEYQTDSRLHIEIIPSYLDTSNESYYILSSDYAAKPIQQNGSASSADLTFSWSNDPSFSFQVTRNSTGDVIFSTAASNLVFENQFLEIVTSEPSNYHIYGLGEVIHGLELGTNLTRTIYGADVGDPIDRNLYGSHPFALETRWFEMQVDRAQAQLTDFDTSTSADTPYTSYSHGTYLRNAHGLEILLRPENITWRAIGGSFDLYFFSGPSQPEVTRQYQDVIGYPAMQQYYTYGFHQCRWGYENWSVVEDVVNRYTDAGIPLETIWTDIDYMKLYRNFDNDPVRYDYQTGQTFLQRLHDNGRHYVPIVDAAIYVPNPQNDSDAYDTFNRGNATNSWLLNPDGSLYIGAVWPGYTVFPDLLSDAGNEFWVNELVEWHRKIEYDGIWIDMNEPSSFCVGSCGSGNVSMNPVHPPFPLPGEPGNVIYDYPEGFNLTNAAEAVSASAASASQVAASFTSAGGTASASFTSTSYFRTTPSPGVRDINYPPYVINHVQRGADLAVHAVSPNASHNNGVAEYDVHNYYGASLLKATYVALSQVFPGKRPFIIGRSTFPGSGTVSGHWGGDNASKWYYMFFSIPQALSFSLFGIPMFGVDACGFNGNSAEELCNRWMQLSAFFPFYRNHNVLSAVSQEAYVWASVIDATKAAMNVRFQLLPYLYTLFYLAHTKGDTVMRALAWEFPIDPTLAAADRQFFLGPSILVTPVLEQGATTVDGVFPGNGKDECYYDWYTQSPVPRSLTGNVTISAPLGHIPVYIRGGAILPTQPMALTTREARTLPWSVYVALDTTGSASGYLYLDDGESLNPNATKEVSLSANGTFLTASVSGTFEDEIPLAKATIMGMASPPNGTVTLNDQRVESAVYDAASQTFKITGLQEATVSGAWAADWTLRW